jgi:hypothetical protein
MCSIFIVETSVAGNCKSTGLAAIIARARFHVGTFALQEALWGIEHGDQDAVRSGLARYV